MTYPHYQFQPGPLSWEAAAALNEIQRILQEVEHPEVSPPLMKQGNAWTVITDPESFWAKITGSATVSGVTVYSWVEQFFQSGGTWVDLDGGRSGSTSLNFAYEVNHTSGVATGTIVVMRQGFYNVQGAKTNELEYLFVVPAGGGGTFNNPVTFGTTVNFAGPVYYEENSYLSIFPSVGIGIWSPTYYGDCVIIAGIAPAAPTSAPTYSWGSSGTGSWTSGATHTIKVTQVMSDGAESGGSPAVTTTGAPLGGVGLTVNFNNTPVSGAKWWRVYVSPDNVSGSETAQATGGAPGTPVYNVLIGTASVTLPGPYATGKTFASGGSGTQGCFRLPLVSAEPSWTDTGGVMVLDLAESATGGATYPTLWIQMTSPTGTTWMSIIGTGQKGDLIVGAADDGEAQTLKVTGTDNLTFLAKDSSTTQGVKWYDWTTLANYSSSGDWNLTLHNNVLEWTAASGGSGPGTPTPGWIKVSVTKTDFNSHGAINTFDFTAIALGVKGVVMAAAASVTTAFSDPGADPVTIVLLDDTGGPNIVSVSNTTGATTTGWTAGPGPDIASTIGTAVNCKIRVAMPVSGTLNLLNAGAMDVWFLVATLP